ncbi:MAG: NFACT RNA binding domain-containing protein [Eubacteriales bacterium]|nr:NFACT RNA binding domain-containing protein [Eubacteriales bacterium]
MAYDGIAVAATVKELNDTLLCGSITKIAQPERDEILLTVKNNRQQRRLSISASASLPMVYLKEDSSLSPASAPNFCMTLRKHIGGGRLKRIYQPADTLSEEGLERIIAFEIEHLDELGDLSVRVLVCELMGKHSNIILLKEDGTIIDSIKHITPSVSSVREVLPGRDYFIPETRGKKSPLRPLSGEEFSALLAASGLPLQKALFNVFTGISPVIAEEICYRAGVDGDVTPETLSGGERNSLYGAFCALMDTIRSHAFVPNILYRDDQPEEFSAVELSVLLAGGYREERRDSMSEVLCTYYEARAKRGRIRAKSEDMRRILKTLTERTAKKLDLQERQYQDAEKKDKFRIYGELLNTYGYSLSGGEKELVCQNYYDGGKEISVPLDTALSAKDNAKKYFDRYQKLKRTQDALLPQIGESKQLLWHLDSISEALSIAETEADLNQLRREMAEYGFIKKPQTGKRLRKEELKSDPMHFVSSDGIDLYVGRNNYQNEEITFKLAEGNDWWFHAKNMPGSHVIAKTGNRELPDATCLEAAALAAYYSKACGEEKKHTGEKVEVDYVQRKALKRVPKAAPGYVIYHTNYSIMVEPRNKT